MAIDTSAAGQSAPMTEIGRFGQAIRWAVDLEPTPFGEGDSILLVARGVVGAATGSEIGWLRIEGTGGRLRLSADFPALGGAEARVLYFTAVPPGGSRVVEPLELADGADLPRVTGTVTAAATGPAEVEVLADRFPVDDLFGPNLTVSLNRVESGGVVPAPWFEVILGRSAPVVVGGRTVPSATIRFVARAPFPPSDAPSATLERVDVVTNLPSLAWRNEHVEPGLLFGGVPVLVSEGVLGVEVDPARERLAAIELGETAPHVARLAVPFAAGVAVSWDAADLESGEPGAVAHLAAVEESYLQPRPLGEVEARRTSEGWNLWFRLPGAQEPAAVEVDGQVVAEVRLAPTGDVFALAPEPPTGAEVFPTGLGDGAFYGFSWDRPVPIFVPGAGSFTGRTVRIVFARQVGGIAHAVIGTRELPSLTLTGLSAPAADDHVSCVVSATSLCLAGDRFAVEVFWIHEFRGAMAVGRALTDDTGSFWFFDERNLELVVKVLDGCSIDGHFWVFAAGLTNVSVELRITDTRTGMDRSYRNPRGQAFQPIQDTAAFATCRP